MSTVYLPKHIWINFTDLYLLGGHAQYHWGRGIWTIIWATLTFINSGNNFLFPGTSIGLDNSYNRCPFSVSQFSDTLTLTSHRSMNFGIHNPMIHWKRCISQFSVAFSLFGWFISLLMHAFSLLSPMQPNHALFIEMNFCLLLI